MIKTHLLAVAADQHAANVAAIESFSPQFRKFEAIFSAIAAEVPVLQADLSLQADSDGPYLQWMPQQNHEQFATVNRVLLENDFRVQTVPGVVFHHSQSWYSYDIDNLRLQIWSPIRPVVCVGCGNSDAPGQPAPARWAQWRKVDSAGICSSCAKDSKVSLVPAHKSSTWPSTPEQQDAMAINTASDEAA